ncbi:DNase I-like protein [Dendrothele bispora CBS 962.96]|uniref:DNase I-like protein n=1 Tax=Dendrothele bispora (strain CBS 962.96) TaxID=1314807 RepID=A0A4S8L1J4_DENBC|nr:DNase I-like protein [Dendrothele bispora CBS 962.96]
MVSDSASHDDRLLVQIASYNTNLQGSRGVPQDLVDWLSPTLQVSTFLSREPRAPDIVAVGFQELLPLHLGLSGLSKPVINERADHILSQIETHAPNKEKYTLLAKVVNAGVALLVYGRDDTTGSKACDVQTSWTGCGFLGYMGNKGAVGVRFRVPDSEGGVGETYTFVCAHLTAHEEYLSYRIADYRHIVSSLLFSDTVDGPKHSTIYSTSHLFFLGDLNFRVAIPPNSPVASLTSPREISDALKDENTRATLKDFDQLSVERKKNTIFVGLREGEFWKFKCSYKYELGAVDKYSGKRMPSWTDRVLYATHTDSADTPDISNITNILYTSIPSYTTSDHKPIVALLLVPRQKNASTSDSVPVLKLPAHYTPKPDPLANLKRYTGRSLDRTIGIIWWLLTMIGAGSAVVGLFNFIVGLGAWNWWRATHSPILAGNGSTV